MAKGKSKGGDFKEGGRKDKILDAAEKRVGIKEDSPKDKAIDKIVSGRKKTGR